MRYRILLILALLISLSACEINRLRQAEELHNNRRYASAIQELDRFIRTAQNGALITRAELLRSSSYLELAKMAIQRQNWPLAIRFLKISNSPESDQELALIYRTLAIEAEANRDLETSSYYLNMILREIPESILVPEVLYRKLVRYFTVNLDNPATWSTYKKLYDAYPDNPYEIQARNYASRLIPAMIDYARTLSNTGYHTDALALLFEIDKYPVVDHTVIQRIISDVYQAQAEELLVAENYLGADQMFRIALQYNPDKRAEINARLSSITQLFIERGDRYLAERDFENALIHYNKTFEIIPGYEPAVRAIERLNQVRINIARAQEVVREAENLEAGRRYSDALRLYQQAFQLEAKPEYRQKIQIMQNLIEAERNPEGFAQRIINEYRGGSLNNKLRQQKANLLTRYRPSEIRDTGWKILLSTGQYKYEARYDILTPQETFFYVWQVNLRDRTILPLNRISEELMQ